MIKGINFFETKGGLSIGYMGNMGRTDLSSGLTQAIKIYHKIHNQFPEGIGGIGQLFETEDYIFAYKDNTLYATPTQDSPLSCLINIKVDELDLTGHSLIFDEKVDTIGKIVQTESFKSMVKFALPDMFKEELEMCEKFLDVVEKIHNLSSFSNYRPNYLFLDRLFKYASKHGLNESTESTLWDAYEQIQNNEESLSRYELNESTESTLWDAYEESLHNSQLFF